MIGTIIKNMRVEKGFSQKELGRLLNLADTTISSYERGNSQPDFDTILMIFAICGYKIKLMDENGATHSLEELSRER